MKGMRTAAFFVVIAACSCARGDTISISGSVYNVDLSQTPSLNANSISYTGPPPIPPLDQPFPDGRQSRGGIRILDRNKPGRHERDSGSAGRSGGDGGTPRIHLDG